jgi:hypothetical protein
MAQSITITFNIDAEAVELLNDFCVGAQYPEEIVNPDHDKELEDDPITNPPFIPNPQSKKAFWKQEAIKWSMVIAANGAAITERAARVDIFNNMNIQ